MWDLPHSVNHVSVKGKFDEYLSYDLKQIHDELFVRLHEKQWIDMVSNKNEIIFVE